MRLSPTTLQIQTSLQVIPQSDLATTAIAVETAMAATMETQVTAASLAMVGKKVQTETIPPGTMTLATNVILVMSVAATTAIAIAIVIAIVIVTAAVVAVATEISRMKLSQKSLRMMF
ncbi:unannotated protein [freshwater metagenome]|uniref:Unannotated protein n=1 Tax=freshwater metagenome TaxID=449393 RepID=A0A6J6JYY3_9ZZZZ